MLVRLRHRRPVKHLVHQAGVGLIEVLVTLLVLAIGLLGLAGLQVEAQRLNYLAYLDSQAQFLLHDLAERMRISQNPQYYLTRFDDSVTASADCYTENCDTPEKLARWDLSTWVTQLNTTLPSAALQIERSGLVDHEYIITVRYDDLRGKQSQGTSMEALRELSVVTRL